MKQIPFLFCRAGFFLHVWIWRGVQWTLESEPTDWQTPTAIGLRLICVTPLHLSKAQAPMIIHFPWHAMVMTAITRMMIRYTYSYVVDAVKKYCLTVLSAWHTILKTKNKNISQWVRTQRHTSFQLGNGKSMRGFGCLIPLWAKEDRIHQPLIKEGHVDSERCTNTSNVIVFLPVFNSTSDVFCVLQKSYARQVKLSCLPYVCYICKQYVAARARNFQTFLGRLWFKQ